MTVRPTSTGASARHRLGDEGRLTRPGAAALLIAFLVVAGVLVDAASLSRTATATATVNAAAKLSLSSTTLAFPDADPDTTPNIPAAGGPITITAKARTTIGSTVTLAVQAANDLKSGLDTILATQMQWTSTGTGFVAGTMSRTAAQTVGLWTSSGSWTGSQTYTLLNSWNYATGTYSTTLTYTLSAP
jgi:hypothetical protein